MNTFSRLTVSTTIQAPLRKVWTVLTQPEHIIHWNYADESWHTPTAQNDLRVGGKFSYRFEAKDKSFGFDFAGIYTAVTPLSSFEYDLGDGRHVVVSLEETPQGILVSEHFDAEKVNSHDRQIQGWQAIMDHLKTYTESL